MDDSEDDGEENGLPQNNSGSYVTLGRLQVTGNALDNFLRSGDGDNTLTGLAGNDNLAGGVCSDTL